MSSKQQSACEGCINSLNDLDSSLGVEAGLDLRTRITGTILVVFLAPVNIFS